MRIKFIGNDPRAGMVAQMDSSRGQELIDAGCAVQVKENEGAAEPPPRNEDATASYQPPADPPEPPEPLEPLEQPESPAKGGKKGKGT